MQRTFWQRQSPAIAFDVLPRQILPPAIQMHDTQLVLRLGAEFAGKRVAMPRRSAGESTMSRVLLCPQARGLTYLGIQCSY